MINIGVHMKKYDEINCKKCGKTFQKTHYAMKFCSNECRNNYHNDERAKLIEIGRKYVSR